jgi:uncharacterized membrane protein YcjF (UPF0283 family)
MDIPGIDGLIQDIEAPFVILAICLLLMYFNSRMARPSKFYLLNFRLVLSFFLLGFIAMLCALMYQDRAVLIALWEKNPVVYSLIYLMSCIFVIAVVAALAFWKLRPELWKLKNDESDH